MSPAQGDSDPHASIDTRLAAFLEQNRSRLLAHARRLLHGQEHLVGPDDLVQSASLSFYHYLRRKPDAELGDALLALARRCVETALNDFRKWLQPRLPRDGQRIQQLPSSHAAPSAQQTGPATAAVQQERRDARQLAVQQAMAELEPLDGRILQLRLDDEAHFTFPRIAALVVMREDAVRMRYRRAIDRLKPVLQVLLAADSELGRL